MTSATINADAEATATSTRLSPSESSVTPARKELAGNSLEEVYDPELKATGDQPAMDRIKKRYEDILVTYFFLKKCGRAQPTDFHIITSALSQEMASINAPGRMQNDILNSARGSYREMYANSACEGEGLDNLSRQYTDYIATLTKNFSQE